MRRWLDLPANTPVAYFHADIKSGGLGVPSLRWTIPINRLNRLEKLRLSALANTSKTGQYLRYEITKVKDQHNEKGVIIDNAMKSTRRFAAALHNIVDGGALKESKKIPQQKRWIAEGTRFLSGRDFVLTCKLRINAIPTKYRTSRGRIHDRSCRAGCNASETLNHVLQTCHRAHDARIRRHDAVMAYLARGLEQRKYRVTREAEFRTEEGVRKPDLIATKMGRSIIIDAQVVNDQTILDLAHKRKTEYYSENASLRRAIATKCGTEEMQFTSATPSW